MEGEMEKVTSDDILLIYVLKVLCLPFWDKYIVQIFPTL